MTFVFLPQLGHHQNDPKPNERSQQRPPRHPARAIPEALSERRAAGAEGPRISALERSNVAQISNQRGLGDD
jgi:hypothetical protein